MFQVIQCNTKADWFNSKYQSYNKHADWLVCFLAPPGQPVSVTLSVASEDSLLVRFTEPVNNDVIFTKYRSEFIIWPVRPCSRALKVYMTRIIFFWKSITYEVNGGLFQYFVIWASRWRVIKDWNRDMLIQWRQSGFCRNSFIFFQAALFSEIEKQN